MKRFLIIIFAFYLLTVGFFMSIEMVARHSPNPYMAKAEYMSKHADSIQVLIFGSSHTYYGLRPEFFSLPTYNMANVSQGVFYDYTLLDKYVDSCQNLEYIICDMSTFTPMSGRLEDGQEWYRAIFYELYMGFDEHTMFSKFSYELSNPRVFKPKFEAGIKELFDHSNLDSLYRGGVDSAYTIKNRPEGWNDATAPLERHIKPFDDAKYKNTLDYYSKIAKICKSRNIAILFLSTPTMSCYYKNVPRRRLQLMNSVVAKTKEIWNKTYYINLLADKRFDDNDFFDTDHLNCENGAAKLSAIINDTILKIK